MNAPDPSEIARLARITGLSIEIVRGHGKATRLVGFKGTEAYCSVPIEILLGEVNWPVVYAAFEKENLWVVRTRVAARQRWGCAYCAKIKPLHHHHRTFRSHGRDDREENAIMLCAECHDAAHRKRVEELSHEAAPR